jgi:hypothetical protein
VREGREELQRLLAGLGSMDSTEEGSGLSTVLERSEAASDCVDLVPERGPTPAEDSLASSGSPFPSLAMAASSPGLGSVASLVARIRRQREALDRRAGLDSSPEGPGQPASAFFSTVAGAAVAGNMAAPQQYKINKDFVKKVLEFSRSSSDQTASSTVSGPPEVRIKVVIPDVSSSLPAPSPPSAPKQPEQQAKLRYYIEKLLQLRHEDVQNLSSPALTASRPSSSSSSSARKQVRFQEARGASSWLNQTADTTLYSGLPAGQAVRRVEMEVQESVSLTTTSLLLHQSALEQVSCVELQAQYRHTRERLQSKLSVVSVGPASPGLSSGLLSGSASLSKLSFSALSFEPFVSSSLPMTSSQSWNSPWSSV